MRNRAVIVVSSVLLGLVAAVSANAQVPIWVGAKVVTKFKIALRVGNRVLSDGSDFHVYTVGRVNGDWLWLVSDGVSGWVRSGEVVPFDQAVAYYTEQLRVKPDSAHTYLCRSLVLKAKGKTEAAMADLDQALQLDPKYAAALNNRGVFWLEKGRYDKAIADYTEALRFKPDYIPALFNRGTACLEAKQYDQAIADLTRAHQIDPGQPEFLYYRGLTYEEAGDTGRAISNYNEALRLKPDYVPALFNRGFVWFKLKTEEYSKAIADFEQVVRLDPKNDEVFNELALLLATSPDARLRNGPKAVELAKQACALSGATRTTYLATLAAAYAEAGDFARAIETQEKANTHMANEPEKSIGIQRLRLYKARKPYHVKSRKPVTS